MNMTNFYDIGALLNKNYVDFGRQNYEMIFGASPYKELKERVEEILAGNQTVIAAPGVPGAGKTTFYAYILAKYLKDDICREGVSFNYLYIYIAPTNDLVRDFIEKFLKFLKGVFGVDCRPEILSRRIRVYGSKVSAPNYPQLLKAIDDEVVLVASTDWQRVAARILARKEQVYLIDEASRMTFTRFFISIADAIAKGNAKGDIRGFTVIGDENQAIGLDEEERRYLLLSSIREMAEKGSDRVYVIPLNVSWRLPEDTARPIKVGFYNGNLIGRGTPLKVEPDYAIIQKLMREKPCQKYSKYIWDILQVASSHPLVHIELSKHFQIGEKYDEKRAELGWCLAYVLSSLVGNRQVSVVVPYTQMAFAVRILSSAIRTSRPPQNVRVATIASYLGREDDVIISIFGKEQASQCNTYYLRDPYTFNVQLSRQRNALFTIGSADILRVSAEYCIKISEKKPEKKILIAGWEKLTKTLEELQKIKSSVTIDLA
jgi:hypothetical protein